MSRSGYMENDGEDPLVAGRWQGAVSRAIGGKRGQPLLRELATALDAMPQRHLAAGSLATETGEFCTLGTIATRHGIDPRNAQSDYWDEADWESIAKALNVSPTLIREIVYENDEQVSDEEWIEVEICGPVRPYHPDYGRHERCIRITRPAEAVAAARWSHMRAWIAKQLGDTAPPIQGDSNDK